MTLAEEIAAAHDAGRPTFEKLFALKKADLIKRLKPTLHDFPYALEIFERPNVVKKLIRDDEPAYIEIASYSSIDISPTGISFTPEHGAPVRLVSFTKGFILTDIVL